MSKDKLAKGGKSAIYTNRDLKVTQEQWDAIFGKPEVKKPKKEKKRK